MSLFQENINNHVELVTNLHKIDNDVTAMADLATETLHNGGKILFCGNGGSASDSQHLASELTGRFMNDRRPLAAMALSTDSSALTCIGNDYSFDEVFARQIIGLGRKEDLLIGISTSGNSVNVLRAVEEANIIGMQTVGLLGRDGGKLCKICAHNVIVPSNVTARIQECHILIGHTLCGLIEKNLGIA